MRFIKDQEKRMNVKRGKKKSKSDGKGKCMETGATVHKDDSWLAIQGFGSLKRKLKKAQNGVVKAQKTYDDAVKSLTYAENMIKIGVKALHNFARVVVTNKKDVQSIIWIKEEYGFTGYVSVVKCKKRAKLLKRLKEAGIATT